ncbi:MAG: tetratricopeptide repeat protein [Bacteroidota bacterium]
MDVPTYIAEVKHAYGLLKKGASEQAIVLAENLQKERPERPGAYLLLAEAYMKEGRIAAGETTLEKGVTCCQDAALVAQLAVIKEKSNKLKEAEERWHQVVASSPSNTTALKGLARIARLTERYDLSIKYLLKALNIAPNDAKTCHNLAGVYDVTGQVAQAMQYYQRAIHLDPTLGIAYFNLGQLIANQLKEYEKALKVYNQGLEKATGSFVAAIRFQQLVVRQQMADLTISEKEHQFLEQFLQDYVTHERPYEVVPYSLSYFGLQGSLYKQVAEKYANKIVQRVGKKYPGVHFDHTTSDKKVKIGYLSPNFNLHPGGLLVRTLFEHHDRTQFEVHGFSLKDTSDFVNRDIRESLDYYHDVSTFNTLEVAEFINRTGIDILVSLAGYNADMKMEVLALRPAPIQLVMIESHETTGAPFVDYVISDEYLMNDQLRQHFSEKVAIFPCSMFVNCELPLTNSHQSTRGDFGLKEDTLVFGTFNHPKKLNKETVQVWMEVLKNAPDSQLWFYSANIQSAEHHLTQLAKANQVDPDRIVFAGQVAIEIHWERLRHMDVFLDSFGYNAHVTAMEALRVGVPIVTKKGANHNSSLCSSMLHYAGLDGLVAHTNEQFIQIATDLAHNHEKLHAVKNHLKTNRHQVIFDSQLQVKYLEKAFVYMLAQYKRKKKLDDFKVGKALNFNSFL